MGRPYVPAERYPKRRTVEEAEVNADLLGKRVARSRRGFWGKVANQSRVRDLERDTSW